MRSVHSKTGSSRSSRIQAVVLVILVMTLFVYLNTPSNYIISHVDKLTKVVGKHSSHFVREITTNINYMGSGGKNNERSLNSTFPYVNRSHMTTIAAKITKKIKSVKIALEHVTAVVNGSRKVSETAKDYKTTLKPLAANEKRKDLEITTNNSSFSSADAKNFIETTKETMASQILSLKNLQEERPAGKDTKLAVEMKTTIDNLVSLTIGGNKKEQVTAKDYMITTESELENVTNVPKNETASTEIYKIPTPHQIQPAFVRIYKENEFYDKYGLWKAISDDLNDDDKMMKVIQDSLFQQQEPEKINSKGDVLWPPTLWPVTEVE